MNVFTVLIDEMIEKVTLNLFHKPVKSLSDGLPSGCGYYFNNATIVSKILVFLMIVVIIHSFYNKFLHRLFRRMELSELSRSHLIEAIWYTAMCAIGSIAFGIIFKIDYNLQSIEDAYKLLFREKTFLNESSVSGNLLQLFAIFSALHFHSIFVTLCYKGCDLEFYTRLCFMVFFCCTYSVRHVLLGLVCLLLMNVSTLCADLARIFCVLGRKKSHQIYSMKYLAYIFFSIHCIWWVWLFAYFLPLHVLWPMLNLPTNRSEVIALMVVYLMLWTVYWLQMFSAPLSKLIFRWKWCTEGSYLGQTSFLDISLFPAQDEMLNELKQIRSRIQKIEKEQCRSSLTATGKPIFPQHNETKKSMYQAIKCIMALKKRLRQNRERKQNISAAAASPCDDADSGTSDSMNSEVSNP